MSGVKGRIDAEDGGVAIGRGEHAPILQGAGSAQVRSDGAQEGGAGAEPADGDGAEQRDEARRGDVEAVGPGGQLGDRLGRLPRGGILGADGGGQRGEEDGDEVEGDERGARVGPEGAEAARRRGGGRGLCDRHAVRMVARLE